MNSEEGKASCDYRMGMPGGERSSLAPALRGFGSSRIRIKYASGVWWPELNRTSTREARVQLVPSADPSGEAMT